MKIQFVADNHTIIGTQGVRFVEKIDRNWSGHDPSYMLRVTYKGSVLDYTYSTQSARDAQYRALRSALETGTPLETVR